MPKGYITTTEAAERAGLTRQHVSKLCRDGAIKGAKQYGPTWMIPASFKWERQTPGPKPKVR